jgi:hypothetical protein
MKREETNAVRVDMKMNVEGKREKERQKKKWFNTIVNTIRGVGVSVRDIENQDEWRFRTRMADLK